MVNSVLRFKLLKDTIGTKCPECGRGFPVKKGTVFGRLVENADVSETTLLSVWPKEEQVACVGTKSHVMDTVGGNYALKHSELFKKIR